MSEAPRELAEPPKRGDRAAFRIGGRFATVPGTGRWGGRENAYELLFQSAADGTAVVRCVGEPWFDRRAAGLVLLPSGTETDSTGLFPLPPCIESVKQVYSALVDDVEVGRLFRFGWLDSHPLWYADGEGVCQLKSRAWLIPGGWTRWSRPGAWLHESFGRTTVAPDSWETTPQTVLIAAFFANLREHNS